jgi:hypothetical protein
VFGDACFSQRHPHIIKPHRTPIFSPVHFLPHGARDNFLRWLELPLL